MHMTEIRLRFYGNSCSQTILLHVFCHFSDYLHWRDTPTLTRWKIRILYQCFFSGYPLTDGQLSVVVNFLQHDCNQCAVYLIPQLYFFLIAGVSIPVIWLIPLWVTCLGHPISTQFAASVNTVTVLKFECESTSRNSSGYTIMFSYSIGHSYSTTDLIYIRHHCCRQMWSGNYCCACGDGMWLCLCCGQQLRSGVHLHYVTLLSTIVTTTKDWKASEN